MDWKRAWTKLGSDVAPLNSEPLSPASETSVTRLGRVALLSSGETSATGRRLYQGLFERLPSPVRVAILETPAGFELNSALVARRVGDFLVDRLPHFAPAISVVPARRRDGPFSTDDPGLLEPLLEANFIYLGAGSPTYLVRHLKDTLAYRYLLGRHRRGATLCLASAAVLAFSRKTAPVYEIYKAGHDPYWENGLDFFGDFGLDLAMVSHWDNREGGQNLDTSHCFIGRPRMERMRRTLEPTTRLLGLDEHTALVFDFAEGRCQVLGKGGVTVLAPGEMQRFESGVTFPIHTLGPYHTPAPVAEYGPPAETEANAPSEPEPSAEVLALIREREAARQARRWAEADALRERIAALGFEVQDTRDGPRWRTIQAS